MPAEECTLCTASVCHVMSCHLLSYDMAVILTMQGSILPQELGCSVCESHGWRSEVTRGNITRLPYKL